MAEPGSWAGYYWILLEAIIFLFAAWPYIYSSFLVLKALDATGTIPLELPGTLTPWISLVH